MTTELDAHRGQQRAVAADGNGTDHDRGGGQCADIDEPLADRGGDPARWAAMARHYAELAEIRSHTTTMSPDRFDSGIDPAVNTVHHLPRHAVFALGMLIGVLLAVTAYVVMVLVIHNTPPRYWPREVYDSHVDVPVPSDPEPPAGHGVADRSDSALRELTR